MTAPFLLYGSYGYTASIIADLAVQRGLHPLLAGRNPEQLKAQAGRLGLDFRHVPLDDSQALNYAVQQVPVVLNCAGPFSRTYQPIVKACLQTGRHYLDITGEVAVFEGLASLDGRAREAGVMLLPGVGLDVVPSDCLAAHLKQHLPDATQLSLALILAGWSSRGTLLTGVEGLTNLGMVRKDGKLVQAAQIVKTRQVDFGRGQREVIRIPWGDLSTAFHSTGIPNIETYMAFPKSMTRLVRFLAPLMRLGKTAMVQKLLKGAVMRMSPGPSENERQRVRSRIWGEVRNDVGQVARCVLEVPEGHDLTAEVALAVVARVLAGDFKPGFQTPSLMYGADFIMGFEGTIREDL